MTTTRITQIVHWSFSVVILTMLSLGFFMKNTDYNPDLYQIHKVIGVCIFLLVFFRLYWRIKHPWPSSSKGTKYEKPALIAHVLLMILMVLMPLTGFMVSAFSGFGIHIFGVFIVPEYLNSAGVVVPVHKFTYELAKVLHEIFAYTISSFIVMHIAAALKHHFINKDNTLIRMLNK